MCTKWVWRKRMGIEPTHPGGTGTPTDLKSARATRPRALPNRLCRSALKTSRAACYSARPSRGAVAQLGERLNGIQEVDGSIPFSSTITFRRRIPIRNTAGSNVDRRRGAGGQSPPHKESATGVPPSRKAGSGTVRSRSAPPPSWRLPAIFRLRAGSGAGPITPGPRRVVRAPRGAALGADRAPAGPYSDLAA